MAGTGQKEKDGADIGVLDLSKEITEDKGYLNESFWKTTEVTFSIPVKIRKGALDIICGMPWTNAAFRYRRHLIRVKEKERRRKLKAQKGEAQK